MKRVIMILLCVLLIGGSALADSGSVKFVGGKEEFTFAPGNDDLFDLGDEGYSTSDLFDNFKGVMPGDVIEQKIRVENSTGKQVRIYMRAEAVKQADKDFLSQLHLNVVSGNKEIFDAQADERAQLTNNTLLGTFKQDGGVTLTVQLSVPIDLGNEYMNEVGVVPWTFLVEEIEEDDTPQTGDWFDANLWLGGAAVLLAMIFVLAKRRKEA